MLNFLSCSPKSNISQFYSSESIEIEEKKLVTWWKECENIINNKIFSNYFNSSHFDKYYNEVPIQFKDNGKLVYGIIDRLIIKGNTVTIIDYKTHPYVTKNNMKETADSYQYQMQLYQKGVQLLWPEYKVNSTLLFTSIAEQYTF